MNNTAAVEQATESVYLGKVDRRALHNAIKAVALFASADATRFHLCGVHFEIGKGELNIVATDGHTFARATLARKGDAVTGMAAGSFLVQRDDLKLWLAALKPTRETLGGAEVELRVEGGYLVTGGTTYGETRCRIDQESQYPPYRQVIPAETGAEASNLAFNLGVNALYLERVGKAVQHFYGGKQRCAFNGIRLHIPNDERSPELSPIRFDVSEPDIGDLTLVVMPMRID